MKKNFDLRDWVADWPYDTENYVRLVRGSDGREIMQVRTPIGIEQFELQDRPDGLRPHGMDSWLDYHRARLQEAETAGKGRALKLNAEECEELFEESILYYLRYLHLFHMRDWPRVIRDTTRNLGLFDFIHRHGKREQDRMHLEQWRPYLTRMNSVARTMLEWEAGRHAVALQILQEASTVIEGLTEIDSEAFQNERERALEAIRDLAAQVEKTQPLTELQTLERELHQAVESEQFERAATLRDRIRALRPRD
jgi:hypothetical protein